MNSAGVSKVEILNSDGSRSMITSKQEIEQACLEENHKKFQQTNNTPLKENPLYDILQIGETKAYEEILDGTFIPPLNTDKYTKELLLCLQHHPQVAPFQHQGSQEKYFNKAGNA